VAIEDREIQIEEYCTNKKRKERPYVGTYICSHHLHRLLNFYARTLSYEFMFCVQQDKVHYRFAVPLKASPKKLHSKLVDFHDN